MQMGTTMLSVGSAVLPTTPYEKLLLGPAERIARIVLLSVIPSQPFVVGWHV